MDTKFWIRQDRLDNEIEFVDYALAETLLLNARTTLLSESLSIDYWLTNFLYIDLIRIGKKKEASTLKVLKTIKENNFFHLSELRATTSKESIDELLKILPNHTDYGAAIIAERFIDEGKTNELLTALEFSKISFQAQKEILFAINRTENNYSRLTEYYQLAINAKEYDGTLFGMNYKIGDQIEKGEITITTWLDGDFVRISVADNGPGIPERIRHRIFDPFFTTKEVGRGTGQGLTISHNIIVNKHNGLLDFETKKGVGTKFIITLPISATRVEGNPFRSNEEGRLAS
jgi:hypothetical protein